MDSDDIQELEQCLGVPADTLRAVGGVEEFGVVLKRMVEYVYQQRERIQEYEATLGECIENTSAFGSASEWLARVRGRARVCESCLLCCALIGVQRQVQLYMYYTATWSNYGQYDVFSCKDVVAFLAVEGTCKWTCWQSPLSNPAFRVHLVQSYLA